MFNLDKFNSDSVAFRPVSMFAADIEANKDTLTHEIKGKSVCYQRWWYRLQPLTSEQRTFDQQWLRARGKKLKQLAKKQLDRFDN